MRPWLEEGDNRRAFVIISDAFRYEAAQELTTELNGKYRFEATLSSQLGVLPSYTALGMASLLPHKTLAYKGTDVLVDGKSSIASERDGILQAVGGMACKCRRTDGEEEGRGPGVRQGQAGRLHLPQHRRCGRRRRQDRRARPSRPCGQAIDELAALVGYIVNNLNGHHIVVTADHGFLFTETARVETDKSKLNEKPDGTILAKKRYLLGHKLPDHDAAWHGKTERDGRGRWRHGVLDSQGGEPVPLRRRRSLRPRRGHAAGDRRPGRHRQARPGQVGPGDEDQAGDGPGAWQQPPDHHAPATASS